MKPPPSLEEIRAWVAGTLPPEEHARVAAAIEADEELRALAACYADVHAVTAAADELPACNASLEELERRIDDETTAERAPARRTLVPLWLAAAAVLVAFAFVWFAGGRPSPADTLAPIDLRTIPLAAARAEREDPVIPAMLASYRPVENGGIQWVRDLSDANELAHATGRPLFLYMKFAGCQEAERVEATVLRDERIVALASECVPCVVEIDGLAPDQRLAVLERGYPFFELRGAEGEVVANLCGDLDGEPALWAFGEKLRDGIEQRCSPSTLPWELARDLAALFEQARAAERDDRFGLARRHYEELTVACGSRQVFAEAGTRGIERIALAARDALLDARAIAENGDGAAAAEVLAEAVQRFEGTPHAVELERVLEALRRSGSFPPIAWAVR